MVRMSLPELLIQRVKEAMPDAGVDARLFSGDDHVEMRVVSAAFAGKSRVARHQMVYAALGELMRSEVHALALQTWTPDEWAAKHKEQS